MMRRILLLVGALGCSFFITSSLIADLWERTRPQRRDWTKIVPQTQKLGDGIELQIFGVRPQGIRIFVRGTKVFEDPIGDGQISKLLTQKASEGGQHYNIAVRYGTDGDLYRAYAVVGDSVIRSKPYRNTVKGDIFINAAWESPNRLDIYGKDPHVFIFQVDSNDWTLTSAREILQNRSLQVKAAQDVAVALAPPADSAKLIQNFAVAYSVANNAASPEVATNPSPWQKAALKDPTYQYNFAKALENKKAPPGEPVPATWRIADGQTTDAFTDCVAVGAQDSNGDRHYFCSGTIIGKQVVLTAGHCTNDPKLPKPNIVLFGPDINNGKTRQVTKIIPHPQLSRWNHPFNDLSLLILKDPVPDDVTIRTIATHGELFESYEVTVVGFGWDKSNAGSTNFGVKRSAKVPIVTYDGWQHEGTAPIGCDLGLEFAASWLEIFRPWQTPPRTESGQKVAPQRKDTCEGDSGGGAYVRGSGERFVLVGATSRPIANATEYLPPGEKPTICGDGGIYVRIDKYWSDWIEPCIRRLPHELTLPDPCQSLAFRQ